MPWTDLSVEQREIVAEYTRQMRAVVGELARTLNHAKALDLMFDGQVSSAWAALLDHDIILDGSGLAGVSSVTKLEVGVLATAMANLLDTYNTDLVRRTYVKLAGMTGTIG